MTQIIDTSISRALAILKACKCQFIVITQDDKQHIEGDLELAPPKPVRTSRPKGYYSDIYKPLMNGMKVGDVVNVNAPEGMEPNGLRACMGSYSNTLWGNAACVTTVRGDLVELLRIN